MNNHIVNKNKTPTVSVIIPCYNLGSFLMEAILSVNNQSFRNFEIIVVDDGSTDKNTINIIKSINNSFPEIVVIEQKNGGLSNARNNGIKRAKGQLIVCLDADDILEPEYLLKTVTAISRCKSDNVVIVSTWLKEFGERSDEWHSEEYDVAKLLVTNRIHSASMFKKQLWEEIGGYKERPKLDIYEDWDFWLTAVEKGYRWIVIQEPLFQYRIRANSMLRKNKDKHIENYKKLISYHDALTSRYHNELLIVFATELSEMRDIINLKNDSIKNLVSKVEQQELLTFKAEDKYDSLVKSRIIVIAVKLVDISKYIRRTVPTLKTRTRNFIIRHIPQPIWSILKKVRKVILGIKTIEVSNEKWTANRPLVSIVSPFYNQGAFIQETVDSVLSQTYQEFEYIIVDDGSDNQNANALNAIKNDRIKVITNLENLGKGSPAVARNIGIKAAKGKYIVCLDSDDAIDPTYLEKMLVVAESDPNISLVSSDTQTFGASVEAMRYVEYDALNLINNNMVTTASLFSKEAWEASKGYKSNIGYEDWEQWINMAEQGYFGRRIPETLFRYRVAVKSRYVDDRKKHDLTMRTIQSLHPNYRHTIKGILKQNRRRILVPSLASVFVNLQTKKIYLQPVNKNPNVLLAVPWLTFGGAETLILNFCKEIKNRFNLSIISGLKSDHEWEYKFKELSPNIYHLANLFQDKKLYLEFISNYIATRNIDILHIIHTDFVFENLAELKTRHPNLKVIVTMFNDRVEHFEKSITVKKYVDRFTSDNQKVGQHYIDLIGNKERVIVIPNGIDCVNNFNPKLFDKSVERDKLNLAVEDIAIFFVGRLSPEKNPDVFLDVAKRITNQTNAVKFFIIGDGPQRQQVEDTVSNIGKDSVRYLGYQSDIARCLSAADVFVLPSSIEGFPLSILEAMAMRLAVIASDVGAVADVIKDGVDGFVVQPGSIEEISKTIIKLESDRVLLQKVKLQARNKVEDNYSNTVLGRSYTDLYDGVIK